MMKKILLILFVLCLALPVCAKKREAEQIITPMTQLEKRQFQTRTYDSSDKPLIMKAMLNVLQDEGFIVYNANPLLGFIYGVKDFDTSDPNIDITKEFGLSKSRLNWNGVKVATIETTANVTEYGKSIKVRVNLILFATSNCAIAKRTKKMSQLELREMQTRIFDTPDTTRVMKSAINTLQDSGFVIQEIDTDLGFIRAQKTFKKHHIDKKRVAGWSMMLAVMTATTILSYGTNVGSMYDPSMRISNEMRDKTAVVDTNVNVEKFGQNKTKVRFVLVEKILQNADGYSFVKSAPTNVIRLYKPNVYQEFFAQLDKSIFYEGI